MTSKDPLAPVLDAVLRRWLRASHFPEEHDPASGEPWPDDLAAALAAARELRRQAGQPDEPLGPWLAEVLREVLWRDLQAAARHWIDRERSRDALAGLLILEEYLVTLDRNQPPAKVLKLLADEAHLREAWELDEETIRQVSAAAQQLFSSSTYARRRSEGVALLARAVHEAAGARTLLRPTAHPALSPLQFPLPPDFHVGRPGLEQAVLDRLQDGHTHTLVLWGPGGAGKTTLAAWAAGALAGRFPGGGLWIEVHAEESVATLQERIARSLGAALAGQSLAERAGELRALLRGRSCLLVLDDVWATPDLVHLQVTSESGRLLVTTRDAKVADLLGAPQVRVEGLADEEGLALLAAWAGRDLDSDVGRELVARLGGLPLAVCLSGARLRAGDDLAGLLAAFRGAQADLAVLDMDDAATRAESLALCFDLSYGRLADADRQRFAQLGCFAGTFGETAAAAVWNVDEAQARHACRQLLRFALLERDGTGFRLHPLLCDYARQQLAAMPEMEQVAHRRHAAWHIRYALYHPQVLDGATSPAPDLEQTWPDAVAGVRWAAIDEPRWAAWAALLAHADRPALAEAVGPALAGAVNTCLSEVVAGAEQALLHELGGDLALLRGDVEAGLAHFRQAAELWQAEGDGLAASRAWLRSAGAYLLKHEPAAAAETARSAQALLARGLPLDPDDRGAAARLFHWFDVVYNPLVRWPELPEKDVAGLARLAQQAGQPDLAARGIHIHRLWCTTKGAPRSPEARERGRTLAVQACRLWRAGGRPDRADDEIAFAGYELTGRYSRRAAARYARRRSRSTPALDAGQVQTVRGEGMRWWLGAAEKQRVGWLSRMLPRYLGAANAPALPRGSRAWRWVEDILEVGIQGGQRRRLDAGGPLPEGNGLNGPEWQALSGRQVYPWAGQTATRLILSYLLVLEREVDESHVA
jgi:hypothetical protein